VTAVIALVLTLWPAPSADATVTDRVMALARDLRCLVCQNQTLADSQADLAVDLRNQITSMVKAGKTDQDIVDFLVERYGDFVLYRPRLKPTTYVLWFSPFLALVFGAWLLYRKIQLMNRGQA
jgi:cytochrome c-type biogenesis protein CcmH